MMDKHLHDTRPTRGREHKGYGAGMALVKVAVYAVLIAVVVAPSVPLGRNNAQLPAIAHAATTASRTLTSSLTINGVTCPDTNNCYAVRNDGTILFTNNGGTTWLSQDNPISGTTALNGVVCSDTD